MTNIKVDPDNLRNISKRLKELSQAMAHLANDASSAGNSAPSYEGQFRSRVFPLGSNANSNLTRMVADLEDYAYRLNKNAARFEQADNSYSGSRSWLDLLRILREGGLKGFFDSLDKQRLLEMTGLLGLGALFLPPMPWNPTPVYGSDGNAISQNLRGIQVIIGKIGDWWRGVFGKIFPGRITGESNIEIIPKPEGSITPEAVSEEVPGSLLPKSPFNSGYNVTGSYGTYFNGTTLHNGLDCKPINGTDTSIHPIGPGKVVMIKTSKNKDGSYSGYGHHIVIEHQLADGRKIRSTYAHMAEASPMKVGDTVDHDSVLGIMGSTGQSTGPHLHLDIHESGNSSYEYSRHPNPNEIITVDGKKMTRLDEMKMHWIDPAEVLDPNNAGQYQFVPTKDWS
ncbi:MAG: peptidoglycan DD-metalloendopeptidase family protein [Chloroflexi bacterium]|jgi:murein DD-endopeptidase MepM/ murein hydrolase activator NlpD|nr:peptidoglycan DD-metalloendopeptidase family protein [Chloroflexota bacterium]